MIAHVAEAGEDRGRVVLRLGSSGRLSDIALEAAMRVAQAFQSEIESVFVEGTGYLGWRAGIRPDGTWVFFVAGD